MRRLETYHVPRRFQGVIAPIGMVGPRLAPVFRDRDELQTTDDLGEAIRTALRESATLIVICSPAAARSPWVQREIEVFKQERGPGRVFAFIVAGEPKYAGAADDCFPPALRVEHGPDGPRPAEVVAADARPHADGPRLAFVRLVAGLLAVGFDQLRQRELQRRYRQMTLVAAAATIGMGVMLGLTLLAWRARNEAVDAKLAAQRRQDQAEDLHAFVLGDLRDQLDRVGRLDVLESALQKSMQYFVGLHSDDLTDAALVRQAKALTQLGDLRIKQARYADAERAFAAAHARAAAMANRHPRDGTMVFERGQAEYYIGFVHWRRGELGPANSWLSRYRETAQALVRLDPQRIEWQGEAAYGDHNLGVLAVDRLAFDAARKYFLAEQTTLAAMRRARPEDRALQFRAADAVSFLGTVAERSGDFREARERFAEHLRLVDDLVQKDPRTTRWKVRLAHALALEATMHVLTGQRAESLALRRRAREVIDPLVQQDPANKTWLATACNVRLKEGMILLAEGNLVQGGELIEAARAGYEKLGAATAVDRELAGAVALGWRLEAERRDALGRADAREAADRAITLGEALVAQDRASEWLCGDYVQARVIAARLALKAGDIAGARGHAEQAVAAMGDLPARSRYWRFLDPAARALALLGRTRESQAIIEQLSQAGYQPLVAWPSTNAPLVLSEKQ